MYRKKGRGWTKHIDFMLLDVLCMQIAFIVSYIWRFGPGNPYIDKDYRILAVAFLLIDFFVEIVSDAFKNVLKRGYLDEFIATCKHVALVEIITTFFLFTTQMGEIYSRMSYYIMIPIYILVSYLGRVVLKKIIKKEALLHRKITLCHSTGKAPRGDTSGTKGKWLWIHTDSGSGNRCRPEGQNNM